MIPRQPYSYRRDPAVPALPDDRPIIVFDGCCRLRLFGKRATCYAPEPRYEDRFLP